MFVFILVIICALIIGIPVTFGLFLTLGISRGEKAAARFLKTYSFVKDYEAKVFLEKMANRFVEGDNYGEFIIHDPMRGGSDEAPIYFYKKVRFFTVRNSVDMKELAFPMQIKVSNECVMFFKPESLMRRLRNFIEDREPRLFVGKRMKRIQIDNAVRSAGINEAFGMGTVAISDVISSSHLEILSRLKSQGVFSFQRVDAYGMINYDPFYSKLDLDLVYKTVKALMRSA